MMMGIRGMGALRLQITNYKFQIPKKWSCEVLVLEFHGLEFIGHLESGSWSFSSGSQ
jgi:hypothetical protein